MCQRLSTMLDFWKFQHSVLNGHCSVATGYVQLLSTLNIIQTFCLCNFIQHANITDCAHWLIVLFVPPQNIVVPTLCSSLPCFVHFKQSFLSFFNQQLLHWLSNVTNKAKKSSFTGSFTRLRGKINFMFASLQSILTMSCADLLVLLQTSPAFPFSRPQT